MNQGDVISESSPYTIACSVITLDPKLNLQWYNSLGAELDKASYILNYGNATHNLTSKLYIRCIV